MVRAEGWLWSERAFVVRLGNVFLTLETTFAGVSGLGLRVVLGLITFRFGGGLW